MLVLTSLTNYYSFKISWKSLYNSKEYVCINPYYSNLWGFLLSSNLLLYKHIGNSILLYFSSDVSWFLLPLLPTKSASLFNCLLYEKSLPLSAFVAMSSFFDLINLHPFLISWSIAICYATKKCYRVAIIADIFQNLQYIANIFGEKNPGKNSNKSQALQGKIPTKDSCIFIFTFTSYPISKVYCLNTQENLLETFF